jgi:hypothetical protein
VITTLLFTAQIRTILKRSSITIKSRGSTRKLDSYRPTRLVSKTLNLRSINSTFFEIANLATISFCLKILSEVDQPKVLESSKLSNLDFTEEFVKLVESTRLSF